MGQYPPHMQALIRQAVQQQPARLRSETQPMGQFRPSQPIQIQHATIAASDLSASRPTEVTLGSDFLSSVKELTTALTALGDKITSLPTTTPEPAATGGGRGSVQRARRSTRPTTTAPNQGDESEVDQYSIGYRKNIGISRTPPDAETLANRKEFETRQRKFISEIAAAERIGTSTRRPSPGEQAVLNALYPPKPERGARFPEVTQQPYVSPTGTVYRTPAEIGAQRRRQAELSAQAQNEPQRPRSGPPPVDIGSPRFRGFRGAPTRTLTNGPAGELGQNFCPRTEADFWCRKRPRDHCRRLVSAG